MEKKDIKKMLVANSKDGTYYERYVLFINPDGSCASIDGAFEKEFEEGGKRFATCHWSCYKEIPEPKVRPFKDGNEFFEKARDNWFRDGRNGGDYFQVDEIRSRQVWFNGDPRSYEDLLNNYSMYDPIIKEWVEAGVLEDSE